jgi:hypothetical protein
MLDTTTAQAVSCIFGGFVSSLFVIEIRRETGPFEWHRVARMEHPGTNWSKRPVEDCLIVKEPRAAMPLLT